MESNKPSFDFKQSEQEALEQLCCGTPLEGKDGVPVS